MKKLLIIFPLILTGCDSWFLRSYDSIRTQNRQNLNFLSIGMNKQESLKVMGTETIMTDEYSRINNPYRSETYKSKDKIFEILFYYTDVKNADSAITDDELTPLVFTDNKLDGWGWSYWNDLIQKYEIRIR